MNIIDLRMKAWNIKHEIVFVWDIMKKLKLKIKHWIVYDIVLDKFQWGIKLIKEKKNYENNMRGILKL
jgi:hypothetical protein